MAEYTPEKNKENYYSKLKLYQYTSIHTKQEVNSKTKCIQAKQNKKQISLTVYAISPDH